MQDPLDQRWDCSIDNCLIISETQLSKFVPSPAIHLMIMIDCHAMMETTFDMLEFGIQMQRSFDVWFCVTLCALAVSVISKHKEIVTLFWPCVIRCFLFQI